MSFCFRKTVELDYRVPRHGAPLVQDASDPERGYVHVDHLPFYYTRYFRKVAHARPRLPSDSGAGLQAHVQVRRRNAVSIWGGVLDLPLGLKSVASGKCALDAWGQRDGCNRGHAFPDSPPPPSTCFRPLFKPASSWPATLARPLLALAVGRPLLAPGRLLLLAYC